MYLLPISATELVKSDSADEEDTHEVNKPITQADMGSGDVVSTEVTMGLTNIPFERQSSNDTSNKSSTDNSNLDSFSDGKTNFVIRDFIFILHYIIYYISSSS